MEKLIDQFSLGLFFWQALLFIALVLLLKKFAWKPILSAINDREEGIKKALESAEKARQEMKNLKADNQKLIKSAKKDCEVMLREARATKNNIIENAKAEAHEEAHKIITQARHTIQTEKRTAIAELKSYVAEISLDLAEKLVCKALSNRDKQQKQVASMLEDITLEDIPLNDKL